MRDWPRRRWLAVAAVAILVAAVVRVAMSPGGIDDESRPASSAAPPRVTPEAGFAVELPAVPLLVDGRLRVTSDGHRLVAHPLDADADADAHWTYRRDARLLGADVAPDPDGDGPVVVAFWSDHVVVGLDGLTGERRWAHDLGGEASAETIERAAATWDDPGEGWIPLAGDDGDAVVVNAGEKTVSIAVADGSRRWSRDDLTCTSDGERSFRAVPIGTDLVVHRPCRAAQPELLLIDASGDELDKASVSLDSYLFAGDGCRAGTNDGCRRARLSNQDPSGRDAEYAWAVEDGQLIRGSPDGMELASTSDTVEAVERRDGATVWTVPAAADRAGTEITDAVLDGDHVWVTARAWRGGEGGIFRLDLADGTVTGCALDPTGFDGITVYEDGWVAVRRGDSYGGDPPDVTLTVPDMTSALDRCR